MKFRQYAYFGRTFFANFVLLVPFCTAMIRPHQLPICFGKDRAFMRRLLLFVLLMPTSHSVLAQAVPLDIGRSTVRIHVEKSGIFSAFAHNHTIKAPLASGQLDVEKHTISLVFNTRDMKVLDPGSKESERGEIEQTMKSEKVLDVQRFPKIHFTSTSVTPLEGERYQVHGELTLHGVTKSVALPVSLVHNVYTGSVKLRQTSFEITPVNIAGGTIKVKDEISVEFEIVPGSK